MSTGIFRICLVLLVVGYMSFTYVSNLADTPRKQTSKSNVLFWLYWVMIDFCSQNQQFEETSELPRLTLFE